MSVKYGFGDLVKVVGYHPRIFRIDGYHVDTLHYPDETWTEKVFDLVDVGNGVFIEAEIDDLTLVAPADKADDYLANNPAPIEESNPYHIDFADWEDKVSDVSIHFGGGTNMAKQERQPTARELSAREAEEKKTARKAKAEAINNLLDMRNWYADQFAKTADVEYCDRVFAMDTQLKNLTETD